MTDTDTSNLAKLRIPELKALASEKGIRGLSGMRKGDLIAAIQSADSGQGASENSAPNSHRPRRATRKAGKPDIDTAESSSSHNDGSQTARAASENDSKDQAETSQNRQSGSHSSDDSQERTFKSRSQARRARRMRARQNAQENGEPNNSTNNNEGESSHAEGSHDSRNNDRSGRGESNRSRGGDGSDQSASTNAQNADNSDNSDQSNSDDRGRDSRRGGYNRSDRDNRSNNNRRNDRDNDTNDEESEDSYNNRNQRRNYRDDRNDRNDRNDRGNRRNRNERNDRNNRDDRYDRNDRGNRRNRRNRNNRDDRDNRDNQNQLREGETFQPVAGILDIIDNNTAFLRTTGYQSGASDVYVSMNLVRSNGMRRGDAVTGYIRVREDGSNPNNNGRGRNCQKYTPMAKVETINGLSPEEAKARPEFSKLTPLYPNQRLRLETDPRVLTTRVIDLIMPIGKGQRALIVSPPKAGKTTILQNIANAIVTNNPECYLMVVLVDERPEEVTDMQRSVRGEVIASTFDRPPSEHTTVAELAIERAKRLVEAGQDVVVLLDSITRLGRAYNNSSPASGRILSGGVDSNALYPPKRFLGAARNIEDGGSLTIIATAMVETGSAGDTVIFEEFKGTGNAELKLDRKISERRVFPAVDVNPSGTRKDELLLAPEEARIMHKLRRILSALDSQQAIDVLIKQLRKTKNNGEFLVQVASSGHMGGDDEDE